MSLQAINLGVAPSGEGGDTNRQANEKNNANHTHLAALAQRAETVAGGDGFVDASGEITLDLSASRAFHFTVTGNITAWSFTNAPTYTAHSPVIRIVFKQDATGGRTITGGPSLKFRDRRSLSDLNTTANAVNELHVWHDGTELVAALIENGQLDLDDLFFTFLDDATVPIVVRVPVTIDVAAAEVDGAGTVTYAKNGDAITVATTFEKGDTFSVTATNGQSVTVPRYIE